ncbi:hypothetical protein R1sor_017674 [Riccia sorocarpa]|uniref:BAH domain-containing protein n=1 Tax=Riccia sorocarpa TaxID=122646 RepID=A0ABD3IAB0_9MARC
MIYHGTFRTKVFATYKNVRSDSNLTISIIHRLISDWEVDFQWLFGVNKHSRCRNYKLSSKILILRAFEVLEETWDFKTILQTEPTPVLTLHDVTFNQQFKIAIGSDNWPRLWTKKFSTDERWEPEDGEYYATQTRTGRPIPLIRQWLWRAPQDEDLGGQKRELPSTLVTSGEVEKRVFGERRPAYAGPRKSRPGTAEHDRIHILGDLKDLSPGQMVAVLAEDDKSFWVCKVLTVKTRSQDGEADEVEVQWFATEVEDPYVGKYYPEKRKGDGRSRPVLFKQTLLLSDIRILAFDFSLTAAHRLRKSTASHIRTQLFRLEQEVAVEEAEDRNSGSQENGDTSENGVNEEEVNDDS